MSIFFFHSGKKDAFSPLDISNLLGWFDADDASTITTATGVSQWDDKSGNGYHASQGTSANQPATGSNTLNHKNVITFNGTSTSLSLPSALCSSVGNSDSTIIAVARHNQLGNDRILTLGNASNATRVVLRYGVSTDVAVLQNNNTGVPVASPDVITTLDYNILVATNSGTTQSVGCNGGALASNNSGENLTDVSTGRIGATAAGTFSYLDGDIAEILFYDRVLSESELKKIYRYLYQKWGVVIAGEIIPPTKEGATVPFSITYDGYQFSTNLDVADYKITPTTSYSGVTDLRSQIPIANSTEAPYQITMAEGLYDRNTVWDPFVPNFPTEDFNLIGTGDTFLTSDRSMTMLSDTGATYVSSVSQSLIGSVYDTTIVDSNGSYEALTLASDLATCRSTAGSYFVDGSNFLYIHTSDERDLTANSGSTEANGLRVFLNIYGPTVMANITAYTENIRIQGHRDRSYWAGRNTPERTPDAIYAKNCEFSYSQTSGNMLVTNAKTAIIQNCVARKAFGDGFGYHDFAGVGSNIYEIDCEAYDNGNGTSDNSSTIHEGIYAIRLNGIYSGARSRSIHDIDTSMSVNIGCDSRNSRGDNAAQSVNWACGDDDNATMYLINCLSSGSITDIRALNGGTVFVSAASHLLDGNNLEEGNGTINSFVPTVV